MIPVSLFVLSEILKAELIGADSHIVSVKTDTRRLTAGCLFVALKGKQFNAHDFAAEAVAAGARALLVSHRLALDVPQLVVEDTRIALGQLAAWVRQQSPARVVALTGSSGKTSVKEMTAGILNECGETLYTEQNFNNDIGVALTLLRLQPRHDFAVIELGASHIGEIAYTSALARPEAALINNLSAAHLEGFGSLEGVAQAKGEIFTGMPDNGVAIINSDNNDLTNWQSILTGKNIWFFSMQANPRVDFFASGIRSNSNSTQFHLHSPFGSAKIVLPLLGDHNVANALAAAALAMAVGASLKEVYLGLSKVYALAGRMFPIALAEKKLLLDDSYNANVGSMTVASQVLAKMPGYRVMVVGDMDELGEKATEYHHQVGEVTCLAGIDKVISVGECSRILSLASGNGEHYQNKVEVITRVIELLAEHEVITVLIKGSRRASMEQVVCALQENTPC
ncbi:UDP-N-acetylmuramoyl-tripeptide--D-alanyl-D-alanineligase [Serratia symbiotica]|nr:UDP-N-acetylmuramoyl-tripeptide--D-alanyl-D-alanineligase [Serratia symbiotica]